MIPASVRWASRLTSVRSMKREMLPLLVTVIVNLMTWQTILRLRICIITLGIYCIKSSSRIRPNKERGLHWQALTNQSISFTSSMTLTSSGSRPSSTTCWICSLVPAVTLERAHAVSLRMFLRVFLSNSLYRGKTPAAKAASVCGLDTGRRLGESWTAFVRGLNIGYMDESWG